jgi:hypothetical protein
VSRLSRESRSLDIQILSVSYKNSFNFTAILYFFQWSYILYTHRDWQVRGLEVSEGQGSRCSWVHFSAAAGDTFQSPSYILLQGAQGMRHFRKKYLETRKLASDVIRALPPEMCVPQCGGYQLLRVCT